MYVFCWRTHSPEPVDHSKPLVQLHHIDDKEDNGHGHLEDGQSGDASIRRGEIADEDDETDELRVVGGERGVGEILFSTHAG